MCTLEPPARRSAPGAAVGGAGVGVNTHVCVCTSACTPAGSLRRRPQVYTGLAVSRTSQSLSH